MQFIRLMKVFFCFCSRWWMSFTRSYPERYQSGSPVGHVTWLFSAVRSEIPSTPAVTFWQGFGWGGIVVVVIRGSRSFVQDLQDKMRVRPMGRSPVPRFVGGLIHTYIYVIYTCINSYTYSTRAYVLSTYTCAITGVRPCRFVRRDIRRDRKKEKLFPRVRGSRSLVTGYCTRVLVKCSGRVIAATCRL